MKTKRQRELPDGTGSAGSDSGRGTSIGEYLSENGTLTYSNVGTSMLPLLRQGRDLFTVRAKKPGERLQVGDVALYRRPPGRYVLHRIVEAGEGEYVLLGDNCVRREYGIRDEDVLGVMTAYIRNGIEHSVTEPAYRRYTARILRTEKSRIFRKKILIKIGRAVKRIAGKR